MSSRTLRRMLFGAAMLLACASQAAPPDRIGDYAYAMPLALAKDSGVAALRLPRPVYLKSRSAQLNDVRVFDSAGNRVPFALLAPPVQTQRVVTGPPVRIFPLMTEGGAAESVGKETVVTAMDTVTLPPVLAKDGATLVYNASIAIPAERIGMAFSETNTILPVVLGTYVRTRRTRHGHLHQSVFEPVLRGTFYRISQAGAERNSGDIEIPPTHAEQWIARTQSGATARPALRLSWTPSTLLFLANGNGPYRLAFGRNDAPRAALRPSQVAPGFSPEELPELPQAQAGALAAQHGVAAAGYAGHAAILWAALLAGIALLACFARTLLRQMNAADKAA